MMVTHLQLEADVCQATVHVLSILHLPQAVDCRGGLVNVWDLGCLGVNVFLSFSIYGQNLNGLIYLWVNRYLHKVEFCIWSHCCSLNSLYSSHNCGCSQRIPNITGSHPRWDPNTITSLLSGMEMLHSSQSKDALFYLWHQISCTSTSDRIVTDCRYSYWIKWGQQLFAVSNNMLMHPCKGTAKLEIAVLNSPPQSEVLAQRYVKVPTSTRKPESQIFAGLDSLPSVAACWCTHVREGGQQGYENSSALMCPSCCKERKGKKKTTNNRK